MRLLLARRRLTLRTLALAVVLLGASSTWPSILRAEDISLPKTETTDSSRSRALAGPTLNLDCGKASSSADTGGNRLADLMYFVALISPEPVSMVETPGNTQRARVLSLKRQDKATSFLVTCQFEIFGQGRHEDRIDQSAVIQEQDISLKKGAIVDRLLNSIQVHGGGGLSIEVEGQLNAGRPVVSEVRMRFNGQGQSPVTIDLYDVKFASGSLQRINEMVARVSSLTFRKQPGPSRMEVSVVSVRRKAARDSTWENILGNVKGTIANWVMPPVPIADVGQQAMLDFGSALVAGASSFTFPNAPKLKTSSPVTAGS